MCRAGSADPPDGLGGIQPGPRVPRGFFVQKKPARGPVFEAEREGFEPSIELPLYSISSAAPSTTRPPLQRLGGASENVAGRSVDTGDATETQDHNPLATRAAHNQP